MNQSDNNFRVLHLLEKQSELTQREIASRLGMSLGGVNYCLQALANKGLLKIRNFGKSKNKLGYTYLLTSKGVLEKVAMTEAFLKRKMVEYEALKAEIDALQTEVQQRK